MNEREARRARGRSSRMRLPRPGLELRLRMLTLLAVEAAEDAVDVRVGMEMCRGGGMEVVE